MPSEHSQLRSVALLAARPRVAESRAFAKIISSIFVCAISGGSFGVGQRHRTHSGRRNDHPPVKPGAEGSYIDRRIRGQSLLEKLTVTGTHWAHLYGPLFSQSPGSKTVGKFNQCFATPPAVIADIQQNAAFPGTLPTQNHAVNQVLNGIKGLPATPDEEAFAFRVDRYNDFAGPLVNPGTNLRGKTHPGYEFRDKLLCPVANRRGVE